MTSPLDEITADDIREIVADVLEMEVRAIADDADLIDEYEADSLLLIELASRLEKAYGIEIAQDAVAAMRTVTAIHAIVRGDGPEPVS